MWKRYQIYESLPRPMFLISYNTDKSSWRKFVILIAQLLTKMKTLSVICFFLVKRTWMTVKTLTVLMQQQNNHITGKIQLFFNLNKSKPLELITTTVMNDSTVFELNIFFFFLYIPLFARYTEKLYIYRLFLCVPLFVHFNFFFVCSCVIIQTVHMYKYE